jgi:hypothetical protein
MHSGDIRQRLLKIKQVEHVACTIIILTDKLTNDDYVTGTLMTVLCIRFTIIRHTL